MDKRELILNEIETRMKTITVSNNFNTNAGNNVFVWKTDNFHENELPGINITDPFLVELPEVVQGQYNFQTHELGVEIEARCAAGAVNVQTARELIADINKAVGVDLTWDGNAIHTVKTEGRNDELDIDEQGKFLGGVLIRISVLYRTTAWQSN